MRYEYQIVRRVKAVLTEFKLISFRQVRGTLTVKAQNPKTEAMEEFSVFVPAYPSAHQIGMAADELILQARRSFAEAEPVHSYEI